MTVMTVMTIMAVMMPTPMTSMPTASIFITIAARTTGHIGKCFSIKLDTIL
jgi:hypothetical protein